jgi:hypothetical protein
MVFFCYIVPFCGMRKKNERADFNRNRGDLSQKTAISVKIKDTLKKFWWYRAVFVPLWACLTRSIGHKKTRVGKLGNFIGCFILQSLDAAEDKDKYFHGCKVR